MDDQNRRTRREFLTHAAAAAAALASLGEAVLASQTPAGATGLPMRVLGRTGERVSILCLGGWHIGSVKDPTEAIGIMHAAIDEGLTFFDNCWDYHDGGAEEIMGRALADGHRNKVFLMTKNCERDYQGSMRCLDDSLRRLRTNRIDLWQFHEIIYDNDPDWVFEKGGSRPPLEAQQGRQGALHRLHGAQGSPHPPRDAGQALRVGRRQMPINVLDLHYRSFQKQVVPVCLEKSVGVIGMKGMGGGDGIARGAGSRPPRRTATRSAADRLAGRRHDDHGASARERRAGAWFSKMSAADQTTLADRVKPFATDGRFERFKSARPSTERSIDDSTASRPEAAGGWRLEAGGWRLAACGLWLVALACGLWLEPRASSLEPRASGLEP